MRLQSVLAALLICGAALLGTACTPTAMRASGAVTVDSPVETWSLSQKTGYAAGFNIGTALLPDRAYIDVADIRSGISDAAAGQPLRFSDSDQLKAKDRVMALQQQAATLQPASAAERARLMPPFSYAIGTRIVRYTRHAPNKVELDFLADGLDDSFNGRPAKIDDATRAKLQQALAGGP